MTDETREDLALKVLQAFADIEDTTSLESKAHLERIQGYTRDERNAMVSELIKLSYIVNEAFNHGILEHGIICLERGYVFTDSVLAMRREREREKMRHEELVNLQKESNNLVKKANRSAFVSALGACLSALATILTLKFTVLKGEIAKENYENTQEDVQCDSNDDHVMLQPIDSLKN